MLVPVLLSVEFVALPRRLLLPIVHFVHVLLETRKRVLSIGTSLLAEATLPEKLVGFLIKVIIKVARIVKGILVALAVPIGRLSVVLLLLIVLIRVALLLLLLVTIWVLSRTLVPAEAIKIVRVTLVGPLTSLSMLVLRLRLLLLLSP